MSAWCVSSRTLSNNTERLQLVFSVVVLGLTSARLNYTLNVPEFDPVNNGEDFYGACTATHDIVQSNLAPYRPCGRRTPRNINSHLPLVSLRVSLATATYSIDIDTEANTGYSSLYNVPSPESSTHSAGSSWRYSCFG